MPAPAKLLIPDQAWQAVDSDDFAIIVFIKIATHQLLFEAVVFQSENGLYRANLFCIQHALETKQERHLLFSSAYDARHAFHKKLAIDALLKQVKEAANLCLLMQGETDIDPMHQPAKKPARKASAK